MNIYNKLEEIRNKPEHIRMRYVWLMVTLSMLFVLIIWLVSFKSGQEKDTLLPSDVTNSDIVNQFNEQKDSLKNATQGMTNAIQQGADATNNSQQQGQ
ncbi:MAG: hypothetical protein WC238_02710 [Parcubacteria group bacterium]|jgi:hypothetical protein